MREPLASVDNARSSIIYFYSFPSQASTRKEIEIGTVMGGFLSSSAALLSERLVKCQLVNLPPTSGRITKEQYVVSYLVAFKFFAAFSKFVLHLSRNLDFLCQIVQMNRRSDVSIPYLYSRGTRARRPQGRVVRYRNKLEGYGGKWLYIMVEVPCMGTLTRRRRKEGSNVY